MFKGAHYLRRNAVTEAPSNLVFLDTESYISQPLGICKRRSLTLRLWAAIGIRLEGSAITRREVASGDDADSFWCFLDRRASRHRTTWVFAHNLGFDLTQLDFWRKLDEEHFTLKPLLAAKTGHAGATKVSWTGKLCLDGIPTFVVCRRGKNTFRFVDTANYWPTRLYDVATVYGLSKEDLPNQSDDRRTWYDYCLNDAKVIEVAVTSLLARWVKEGSGVFGLTSAALSFTHFRHTCKCTTRDETSVDIVCKPNAREHDIERESYYGGRIQPFIVGERRGEIYHLDVNSLYPFVMRNHLFPRRFDSYEKHPTIAAVRDKLRAYGVVARVYMDSPNEAFPVRISGKQYHCRGKYWTTLCGPELARAIDTGSIVSIETAQYYSIAPLFREWVDYWYGRKVKASKHRDNDPAEYEFVKLILNSLSGKFGQKSRHWVDVPGEYPLVRWGNWTDVTLDNPKGVRKRGIAGNTQKMVEDEEPRHAFPLISAYITAYAREYMREAIEMVGPSEVYYMATDSLICSARAYDLLEREGKIDALRLGMFKVAGIHSKAVIHGANWYELDSTLVVSGLLAKAKIDDNGSTVAEVWESVPSIIAHAPRNDVVISEVHVPEYEPDYKGDIDTNGLWSPFVLNDPNCLVPPQGRGGYSAYDLPGREVARTRPAS